MRKNLSLLSAVCFLLPALITACSSSHKIVAKKTSKQGSHHSDTIAVNTSKNIDVQKRLAVNDPAKVKIQSFGDGLNHLTEPGVEGGKPASVYVNPDFKDTLPVAHVIAMNAPATNIFKAPADDPTAPRAGKKEVTNPAKTEETGAGTVKKTEPAEIAESVVAPSKETAIVVKEKNPAPVSENSDEPDNAKTAEPAEMVDPVIGKYAEMMSMDPGEITNYPLFRFIDDWYGTDYKWGGDDKSGIDCSAFSQKLYVKVYGIDLLRTTREQHRNCERFKHQDDANQGDLVFFRTHRLRISHVGVYLANGYFVHASSSQGVMISNLNNKYWRRRFAGGGRMAKAEHATESDLD